MRSVTALFLASLFGWADGVLAANWFIGTTSAAPGAPANVVVWFNGDGVATDAQVSIAMDESRLTLPVASGTIPGAALGSGSACGRANSNQIRVLKVGTGTPWPVGWTQVCSFPFTVPSSAPAGRAWLRGFDALCASPSGSSSCGVTHGWVTVTGAAAPPPPPASSTPVVVAALLAHGDGAPTVEQLVEIDYTSAEPAPIESLNTFRPLRVRPLLDRRPEGDFATLVEQHPDIPSAKLARYVLIDYPDARAAEQAIAALWSEPHIDYVTRMPEATLHASPIAPSSPLRKSTQNQPHLAAVSAHDAWQLGRGWALVGVVDSGLDLTHPDLAAFAGPTYKGGNYLPAYAYDFTGSGDYDVDERQPVPAPGLDPSSACLAPQSVCNAHPATSGVQCMVAARAGHGTHVAGLIAANAGNGAPDDPLDLQGVCPGCSLSIAKAGVTACVPLGQGVHVSATVIASEKLTGAITAAAHVGVQLLNLSAGSGVQTGYCADPTKNDPWCVVLALLEANDVVAIGAAGNDRRDIQFPANDRRFVAVGGIDGAGGLWDRSPGNFLSCPNYNPLQPLSDTRAAECGSNYRVTPSARRNELVAPAEAVRSTFHRGVDWSQKTGCGDLVGDPAGADGAGVCTGTSMSAPIVTGVFGLLRSLNPLVVAGSPDDGVDYGLRDVAAMTTNRSASGLAADDRLGFGVPDARRASEAVLGRVRGEVVANRVTPLFTLYSAGAQDLASVASPQAAVAMIRYSAASYASPLPLPSAPTPGYGSFRSELPTSTPRANLFVLTADRSPYEGVLTTPLRMVERSRAFPLGCSSGAPSCNTQHRDFALVTGSAEIEAASAAGYRLHAAQGHLYAKCPGDTCMPPGTTRVLRLCNPSIDDCAVFPEAQLGAYHAAGYTAPMFAGGNTVLGYGYPNLDSDVDGLPDGMELIAGTLTTDADSDGDGLGDGVEFPLAGISLSDPCVGPNVRCTRAIGLVFSSGFE